MFLQIPSTEITLKHVSKLQYLQSLHIFFKTYIGQQLSINPVAG